MRLTQIKLVGFKSFVEPTIIPVQGQRVGIVGPNGCGKSNVIDAVRWVLGESSARQLRGESMQDVIFNGAAQRKPAHRASVELIFDNSLGKLTGAWGQYAEIAIKRQLSRQGDSNYFINQQPVRRRDITDLFLGTGVGARAYAIIEQGMIARIIEARPEELRVYLEEAAGVSKYKDRRRETEQRIADTRENLLRVEDVRHELSEQVSRLQAQAEVAQRYQQCRQQLQQAQWQFAWLREQEAGQEHQQQLQQIQKLTVSLDEQQAAVRHVENQLVGLREHYHARQSALEVAQQAGFDANSTVQRLSQQQQHQRDTRQRLQQQSQQLQNQQHKLQQQSEQAQASQEAWTHAQQAQQHLLEQAQATLIQLSQHVPAQEEAVQQARLKWQQSHHTVLEQRQAQQLALNQYEHAQRNQQSLQAREQRLRAEYARLPEVDLARLETLEQQLLAFAQLSEEYQQQLEHAVRQASEAELRRRDSQQHVQYCLRALAQVEGRLHTLNQLQQELGNDSALRAWLNAAGLEDNTAIWSQLRVAPNWEIAVESILRERLHALPLPKAAAWLDWLSHAPPIRQSFHTALQVDLTNHPDEKKGTTVWPPLYEFIQAPPALQPLLAYWLDGYYACAQAPVQLTDIPRDEKWVLASGHVLANYGLDFFAPAAASDGQLVRQREIEALQQQVEMAQQAVEGAQTAVATEEQCWQQAQAQAQRLRQELHSLQRRDHEARLSAQKLNQLQQQRQQREQQLVQELQEIALHLADETATLAIAQAARESARKNLLQQETHNQQAQQILQQAEAQLNQQRQQVQAAQQSVMDLQLAVQTLIARLSAVASTLAHTAEQSSQLAIQYETVQLALYELDEQPLQTALQEALHQQTQAESALCLAREMLEEAAAALRNADKTRELTEQGLEPLRQQLQQARLSAQAAQLRQHQYTEQLLECDRQALTANLPAGTRPTTVQAQIHRLQQEIASLGAVNLAALAELETAQTRQHFLDSQAQDLQTAMETLENAIRRIDRETRERLEMTFNAVNASLGELFPALFGGGQAYLTLLGEEMLSAGVQIFAQPPGKKNSTIHLLSGGEKALTALSLVFALFRLNPAPFCLLDEVDAPLDDANTERFCKMVRAMSAQTQFLYISHRRLTMEIAEQLIGVTMQEQGVSRVVAVDMVAAQQLAHSG